MTRRDARISAAQMLFARPFHMEVELEEFIKSTSETLEVEMNGYAKKLVMGCEEKAEEISRIISENLDNWKLDRISKISFCVLQIGVFELLYATDIDDNIAINEAINCIKAFEGPEAGSFVNGVLSGVYKKCCEEKDKK